MVGWCERLRRWLITRPMREDMSPADWFAALPTLETDRILLRPMTMRDAQDIFAYASDPEVARHVLWDAHRTIRDTRSYLRCILDQYRRGEASSFCIVLKETGHVVGTIGFMWYNNADKAAQVGYSLARSCWNKGLMTEALGLTLQFGFEKLHLHRIEAMHEVDNTASGRVMEKCGMQREGILRDRVFNKGKYSDVVLWSILESDRSLV